MNIALRLLEETAASSGDASTTSGGTATTTASTGDASTTSGDTATTTASSGEASSTDDTKTSDPPKPDCSKVEFTAISENTVSKNFPY